MRKISTLFAVIISFTVITISNAQTADEIINNYFETIGGLEKLENIESLKMTGKITAQGMVIPLETVQTKDGKMYVEIDLQGSKVKQLVSNGDAVYSMNMMTQKMEQMPEDASNTMIKEFKDFPNAFINYKEKGYEVELIGKETKEGTECYKIKLTKDPITIDGETVPNITFYYFDTENFVPIMTESEIPTGPAKGQKMEVPLSDYQEVDGVYFPFTTVMQGMPMTYTSIEINPEVDASEFSVPKDESAPEETDKN